MARSCRFLPYNSMMRHILPAPVGLLPRQPAQVLLTIAVASLPVSTPAQDQVLEIQVIGREVNLVGNALSASEGRIAQGDINRRPMLRTGEVLENVPGMIATQHSGSGKANQYFLRGFNLDHGTDFSTRVDGMPVNMRSHGHGQGYTDLNFLIPELVQEIVYRKGSYYADVGDFSGAGAAQLRSQTTPLGHSATLGAGEFGFGRALLTGSVEAADGTFIYGLEHQRYDGPWDSISEDVGKSNVWLKQVWQQDKGSLSLAFMGYDNAWTSADQVPGRAVRSGLISKLGSIDTTVGGESSRYSLSLDWNHSLGETELQASTYVIDYDMELFSNFSYFTQPQGDQFQQVDDRRILGARFDWRVPGEWSGLPVTNTFGGDIRADDVSEVGLRSSASRQILGDIRLDKVDQASYSLFWQNELAWTSRLRTVLGVRFDRFDFETRALSAADMSTLAANSGSADDDIVTASLGLMYALNDNNELYFSIGEGFHSNDARGVTIGLDPVSGEPVSPADPLVSTLGSELGWRVFFSDSLNATLALWQLDIDSELLFVGDAGNTEDTGVGSERKGVELAAYYQPTDTLQFDLEYSFTDASFVESTDGSDEIPGALDSVVSAGLSVDLDDKLYTTIRVRHFDDFPLDGGARADGSTLVNVRFGYTVSDRLQLALDILNLADSDDHDIEYFYESQLPGEAASVEDNHFHVFEPRSVRLYLNYRF